MKIFLSLALIAFTMFDSQAADQELPDIQEAKPIDLRNGKSKNIIVLPSPDPQGKTGEREIILPEFIEFCHVAADSNSFRWIGASNRMFPWVGKDDLASIFKAKDPVPPRIPSPNKRALIMMFKLKNGKYLTLLPLSGDASVSWLEVKQDGALTVNYGSLGTEAVPEVKVPLLAWYIDDNIYGSIRKTWALALNTDPIKGNASMRSEKTYPEAMKYLGWCTWEQYHKNIDEKILVDVMEKIEASDVPVRWYLIDDGHQEDEAGLMKAMAPDKKKFPNGWQPIISKKSEDGIKWIGIWHGFLSHWNGIHSAHSMENLSPYLMKHPSNKAALLPKDEMEASMAFYETFVESVKNQGFDFMKTDNVSRSTIEYYGTENPVNAQRMNVLSLEKACVRNNIGLMNCSAQNTIDLLNATNSATMRTSPDYQKNKIETSKSQILQSVFNVLWLGQTLWPDHDMFHSSDKEVGEAMSVTKAMSGGPIYLSDDPAEFNPGVISPLCYKDGLLIRPNAPGVPLPESVFSDALYEEKNLYKVIAPLKNSSCAIVAYNLAVNDKAKLSSRISPEDYKYSPAMEQAFKGFWEIPKEGLVIYNWKEQRGSKLENEGVQVEISGFGYELYLLCPIHKGWALVGRPDKYLSPSTVEILKTKNKSITIKIIEAGSIVIYSEKGKLNSEQMDFTSLGEDFYKGEIRKMASADNIVTIRCN